MIFSNNLAIEAVKSPFCCCAIFIIEAFLAPIFVKDAFRIILIFHRRKSWKFNRLFQMKIITSVWIHCLSYGYLRNDLLTYCATHIVINFSRLAKTTCNSWSTLGQPFHPRKSRSHLWLMIGAHGMETILSQLIPKHHEHFFFG